MSVRPLVSNAIGEMGITQLLLKLNPLFVFLTLWGIFWFTDESTNSFAGIEDRLHY